MGSVKSKSTSKDRKKTGSPEKPAKGVFHVVGLGSSAGGLEALEEFFKNLPADTGMAFVVVSHQHVGHVSLLPELLSKYAPIPAIEAVDGVLLKPNHIYVSPPGAHLGVMNAKLHLLEGPPGEMPPLPIDFFFRLLATDQQERAICIVLSGTGTDGTLGLKAIKEEAGMAMVQEAQTAGFAGMPSSAIATSLVDYVLPPADMPRQLVLYAQGMHRNRPVFESPEAEESMVEPLQKIFMLLRSRTGHDFSEYKKNSILRRIERRIIVHNADGPAQYVRFLQEYPHEIDLLFKELLIGVTSFFRDPDAFAVLQEVVLPELLSQLPTPYTFRVWIPGCGSGEEAYSLAIVLHDCVQKLGKSFDIQIFATDLNNTSIEYARAGRYPAGIAADVPADLLERHFAKEDGFYRVRREIREHIVFAEQNVIKDPPFTKLDLLCCRNLLIYLNAALQKRLLPIFHYALKPNGILLLGPSESLGTNQDLFSTLDQKWKLFRRLNAAGSYTPPKMPAQSSAVAQQMPLTELEDPTKDGLPIAAQLQDQLLNRFVPPSLVVNTRGDIIFIHGRTGAYLELRSGQPRMNIHDMASGDLALAIGSAMGQAVTQDSAVVRERVGVGSGKLAEYIDLSVVAMLEPEALRGLLLITFVPTSPLEEVSLKARSKGGKGSVHANTSSERMAYLERELDLTRNSLQRTVEELETANEQLRSANEELQSANEELQSTNEELETSKEELQSLNEELNTVNAELQGKLDALSQANDDMQNLLNSTNIATIFLDNELCIKRYTDKATGLINLIPSDRGRPIADLVSNLQYDTMVNDAQQVLRTLIFDEQEVMSKTGKSYLMRMMPYRTSKNLIEGLTITFVELVATEREHLESHEIIQYLRSIFDTLAVPTLLLDSDLRVAVANKSFYKTFKISRPKAEGHLIYQVGSGLWSTPTLKHLLEDIIPEKKAIDDYPMQTNFPGRGELSYLLNARQLERASGLPSMILMSFYDLDSKLQGGGA